MLCVVALDVLLCGSHVTTMQSGLLTISIPHSRPDEREHIAKLASARAAV